MLCLVSFLLPEERCATLSDEYADVETFQNEARCENLYSNIYHNGFAQKTQRNFHLGYKKNTI